ncbi:glycosyltransferase family 2 protein [Pseudooceanicola nanhaiensis]|uniref:glycosyltransferase family 2 protein n=1 Tax=Pseudooceanicola nanhaiensis TaxID=375761 RepID=UPI001CD5983B|nr:glycosyltransferase family 2 protein [Pseudooceanicola nanhaiensis]MCA0922803.1 glycosyltransferase [Pseudooceanicola nanhaiensis]
MTQSPTDCTEGPAGGAAPLAPTDAVPTPQTGPQVDTPAGTVPAISVIVPVYNVKAHVAACLASLRAQSFTDFEAIVIDDGSTDGSGALAAEAVAGDPRFRVIRQENAGLSAARNAGLDLARGSFLAFLDSDDRLAPAFLERMHGVLAQSDSDWVACAIRFVGADGKGKAHPGVHGAQDMTGFAGLNRVALTDWREVVRIFPSAWNKLYRRSLVEGLRFDEGLNYEDHAFYWRAAARTDHILHLSEPLYVSTQGRPGQITRDGSDRVFEQFDVLEILRGVLAQDASGTASKTESKTGAPKTGAPKTGAREAFAEIATRLTFERYVAITDPARRARFADRAAALLAEDPVSPERAERLGVPASWCARMAGELPLSVVIPSDGNLGPLRETLQALAGQHLRDFETLVVLDGTPGLVPGSAPQPLLEGPQGLEPPALAPERAALFAAVAGLQGASLIGDSGRGVAAARNRGLEAARGGAVLFLDAGDRLPPAALESWLNRLRRSGAELGFAGMIMGDDTEHPHSGLHEPFLRPGMPAGTGPRPGAEPEAPETEQAETGASETGQPGPGKPETGSPVPGDTPEAIRATEAETARAAIPPSWGPPPPQGGATAGLPPEREDALRIHAHPSAKLFDRAFLLREGLRFAPEPLSSWTFLAAALSRADRIVALGPARVRIAVRAETRLSWRAPVPAEALAAAVRRTQAAGGLEAAQAARLFVRAVWEKANFAEFADPEAREAFLTAARAELTGFLPDGADAGPEAWPQTWPLDPYVGPWLQRRLGLAGPETPAETPTGTGTVTGTGTGT